MVQNLESNFLPKKCHKVHHIDQRNVLNVKVCVVGAKNPFFSKVKGAENWPKLAAEFRRRYFVIRWGGGGGGTLYPSLLPTHHLGTVAPNIPGIEPRVSLLPCPPN